MEPEMCGGFAFASWASRIPQIRDRLHLDPSQLGLLALAAMISSVLHPIGISDLAGSAHP